METEQQISWVELDMCWSVAFELSVYMLSKWLRKTGINLPVCLKIIILCLF